MKFLYSLLLLVSFVAASAFGGTIVRQCYGCRYSSDIETLSHMEEMGDNAAIQKMYDRGSLTFLKSGEKVAVEEVDWNPNLRVVRRQGDIAQWYIPMQCVSISY
jgi:hypothetical protein